MELLSIFLLGAFWVLVGGYALDWADPFAEHDDVILGKRPSIAHLWLVILTWPLALFVILSRR